VHVINALDASPCCRRKIAAAKTRRGSGRASTVQGGSVVSRSRAASTAQEGPFDAPRGSAAAAGATRARAASTAPRGRSTAGHDSLRAAAAAAAAGVPGVQVPVLTLAEMTEPLTMEFKVLPSPR
jgi:hypothetical protein